MTAVQRELKRLAGASPEAIAAHFFDNFGVVAEQYLDGRIWLFDYDQLAAHKHRTSSVVMASRGLVLDAETFDIIRRPFERFFNIGEAPTYEANIDYALLEAQEKADGSLVTLYFNPCTGHWHFGTRGTPFAEARHRKGGVFYQRILQASGLVAIPGSPEFDAKMAGLDSQVTYLFELIGPNNPHVTPYERDELVLLGARHLTGEEFAPKAVASLLEDLRSQGWTVRAPRRYPIDLPLTGLSRSQQVEAIKNWVATSPEFKGLHEGVVCYDPLTGKRLKVKTPLYCAVHLQGDERNGLTISPSRIAQLLVAGDAEEFCLYFPALAPKVRAMAAQVHSFIEGLSPIWEEVRSIEGQKDFALAVQTKVPGAASGIFFQARKAGTTPALAWLSLPLSRKSSLVGALVC